MTEYQIQANTRRCVVSGRELKPGEKFYSVLLDEGGKLIRQDFSSEAWQGPPTSLFSFWAGRIPENDEDRRPQIDDEMLIDCFLRLKNATEPRRISFRYVVALLLMRRKRFRFEEAKKENGQEALYLLCPKTRTQHRVINPGLTEQEMAAVQEEVFKVLGWQ